jgi:hypothetical protein
MHEIRADFLLELVEAPVLAAATFSSEVIEFGPTVLDGLAFAP